MGSFRKRRSFVKAIAFPVGLCAIALIIVSCGAPKADRYFGDTKEIAVIAKTHSGSRTVGNEETEMEKDRCVVSASEEGDNYTRILCEIVLNRFNRSICGLSSSIDMQLSRIVQLWTKDLEDDDEVLDPNEIREKIDWNAEIYFRSIGNVDSIIDMEEFLLSLEMLLRSQILHGQTVLRIREKVDNEGSDVEVESLEMECSCIEKYREGVNDKKSVLFSQISNNMYYTKLNIKYLKTGDACGETSLEVIGVLEERDKLPNCKYRVLVPE